MSWRRVQYWASSTDPPLSTIRKGNPPDSHNIAEISQHSKMRQIQIAIIKKCQSTENFACIAEQGYGTSTLFFAFLAVT